MCLFFTYGTFWIVAGTQLIPWFAVGGQYSTPIGSTLEGMEDPSYLATFGVYGEWLDDAGAQVWVVRESC